MARRSNIARTTSLRLSTTPQVVELLERLAKTGFHGKNAADVAEEILRRQLVELLRDEPLIERLQRAKRR